MSHYQAKQLVFKYKNGNTNRLTLTKRELGLLVDKMALTHEMEKGLLTHARNNDDIQDLLKLLHKQVAHVWVWDVAKTGRYYE